MKMLPKCKSSRYDHCRFISLLSDSRMVLSIDNEIIVVPRQLLLRLEDNSFH